MKETWEVLSTGFANFKFQWVLSKRKTIHGVLGILTSFATVKYLHISKEFLSDKNTYIGKI